MSNYDYCTNKVLHLDLSTEQKVEMLNILQDIKFLQNKLNSY